MIKASLQVGVVLATSLGSVGAWAQSASTSAPAPVSTKKGYAADVIATVDKNTNFRRVLYTGKNMQLVAMSLKPGEEIGAETHDDVDQFFRFERGTGVVVINGVRTPVKAETMVIVPAGALHNVINTGKEPLRLYTIYTPPEHKDKTVHVTKSDAETKAAHYDGKPTE